MNWNIYTEFLLPQNLFAEPYAQHRSHSTAQGVASKPPIALVILTGYLLDDEERCGSVHSVNQHTAHIIGLCN